MLLNKSFYHPLALSLALATVTTCTLSEAASAATFNFSFSNLQGPVSGTVEGLIELPDGDGTFSATSVIVTSAPAALGYTLPFDVFANYQNVIANSFTVSGGAITDSSFFAQDFSSSAALGISFFPEFDFGNILSTFLDNSLFSGVQDANDSTLTFTPVPTAVPEPAAVLGLLSIAGVGLLSKRQKQEK
jgi:hypothetical protein